MQSRPPLLHIANPNRTLHAWRTITHLQHATRIAHISHATRIAHATQHAHCAQTKAQSTHCTHHARNAHCIYFTRNTHCTCNASRALHITQIAYISHVTWKMLKAYILQDARVPVPKNHVYITFCILCIPHI
jgi:hypothetical protein